MIDKAAVEIMDYKQEKLIIIPCHRHSDAFEILHLFGYKLSDYRVVEQGFLTDNNEFLNRVNAKWHAIDCGQIQDTEYPGLYSEDLW